jgi:hypothetical protein
VSPTLLELAEAQRRPSNIGRISLCNGQPIMAAACIAEDGQPKAAPEADLGTAVHGWVHKGVLWWRDGDGKGGEIQWGEAIAMACDAAAAEGMDSWSVHCIQLTLEFYRDLIKKYNIEREHVLVEHQLDMASTGFRRKGTVDLALVIPYKLLIVVDLKAGFVDQGEAADHDQLSVYSAAGAETFKTEKVIVWIYQPREKPANRASAAEFDADTLRATTAWSRDVLERSRKPNAELRAGFTQCATCPALRRCPVAKAYIMDTQEALAVLGAPTTPEAWGEAIGGAKLAEKWGEQWKEAGKAHLMNGGQAMGFKLGAGRSIESVANPVVAFAALREAGMEIQALEAMNISAGKLTLEARAVIESHITTKISAPSLVADKRGRAG